MSSIQCACFVLKNVLNNIIYIYIKWLHIDTHTVVNLTVAPLKWGGWRGYVDLPLLLL